MQIHCVWNYEHIHELMIRYESSAVHRVDTMDVTLTCFEMFLVTCNVFVTCNVAGAPCGPAAPPAALPSPSPPSLSTVLYSSEGAPSAALIGAVSRRSVLVTLRVALALCVLSRLEIRIRKFETCRSVRGFVIFFFFLLLHFLHVGRCSRVLWLGAV